MICYRLMEENTAHHDVSLMARLLGASRQGYYAWKKREPFLPELACRHCGHWGTATPEP